MQQFFVPKRAYFEPEALTYALGQQIYERINAMGVPVLMTSSHNRIQGLPGTTPQAAFREAKQTLVVGVRKSLDFSSCKPSAHYQLPLNTSCPGMCEYCYLATTLGKRPYVRVYVNIDEILSKAGEYINSRAPAATVFEGAAVSDPVPTEYLTGLLQKTIVFFGAKALGRFRFVTKYTAVDSLLDIAHCAHTRFRFSLNAQTVMERFEHHTPALAKRIAAAAKVARAEYPLGFIIAPIICFDGWQRAYEALFIELDRQLPMTARRDLTFEFITHRFTPRAKNQILSLFPATALPLEEATRQFKYGQFGYGKYIYPRDTMDEVREFMRQMTKNYFPDAKIEYFV